MFFCFQFNMNTVLILNINIVQHQFKITEFRSKTRNLCLNTMIKWSVFYREPFCAKKSFDLISFPFFYKDGKRDLYEKVAF